MSVLALQTSQILDKLEHDGHEQHLAGSSSFVLGARLCANLERSSSEEESDKISGSGDFSISLKEGASPVFVSHLLRGSFIFLISRVLGGVFASGFLV